MVAPVSVDHAHVLEAFRILCGLWFLPHIVGKLRNLGPAAGTFERAGLKPGAFFVRFTIALELVACASLVTGIFAPVGAALAVVVLLGAAWAVLRINGWNWRWQRQGPEYMLFWAAACAASVL